MQNVSDADIKLVGSDGTTDTVKLDAGTNITLTASGGNTVLIDAAAASGLSSFVIATDPVSTSGSVDVTDNTLTFTEQVNTINAVNYNYIGLDISATNILTVGLTAPTGGLTGSTVLTSYLRADNQWIIPPDTTYNVFTAASVGVDGTTGLVPQPIGSGGTDYNKFLKGDGTWATPAGAGTLTGVSVTLPLTVDSVSDPAVPALDINNFGGATSVLPGTKGTVLAPTAGQEGRYLKGDGTWGQPVTSITLTDSSSAVGTPITSTGSFTITGTGTGFVGTTVSGTTITLNVTDTDTTYTADNTSLTLTGTQFSITAGNASDLTDGVTPAKLSGAPGNGTLNEVLASDGAGGFTWNTATASGVNQITVDGTDLDGDLTMEGTGDSTVGLSSASSLSITSAGTGYLLNMIYPTTVVSSVSPGSNLYVKVTSIGGSGDITGIQIYAGGQSWTSSDTVSVTNNGSSGSTAQLTINGVEPTGEITISSWNGILGTVKVNGAAYSTTILPSFRDADSLVDSNIKYFTTNSGTLITNSTTLNGPTGVLGTGEPKNGYGLNLGTQDIGITTSFLDSAIPTGNIRIGVLGLQTGNPDYQPTTDALTANSNISIGNDSASLLTTGSRNTYLGAQTGMFTTTGYGNLFLGDQAGSSNLDMSGQTFKNRAGFQNIALGYRAYSYGIGTKDLAIGWQAGQNLSTSSDDQTIAPGTGQVRIAIGPETMSGTLDSVTDRFINNQSCIAIGNKALKYPGQTDATATTDQIYIGSSAGLGATAATSTADNSYQIGIGTLALSDNTGRLEYIAIGHFAAMLKNASSTDTYGIAIGNQALGSASVVATGSDNIAIGRQAGYSAGTKYIEGGTIAIGYGALAQGENSIAIGKDSEAASGSGVDNSIAIGYGAQATFSNSCAIGTSAATASANTIAIGSSTQNLGVIASSSNSTTHKWQVRINGVDYYVLLSNV